MGSVCAAGGAGRLAILRSLGTAAFLMAAVVNVRGLEISFESPPPLRSRELLAWSDVDGDGRRDLVRQVNRRLDVYLMGENHHVERVPAWSVEIAAPWDLWDFGDVRSELPGDELLALSPTRVGWLSFHKGTTTTARMETLISEDLPVRGEDRRANRGRYVVSLAKDEPTALLLPSRKGLNVYRRAKAYGYWEKTEELTALLQPRPRFGAGPVRPHVIGFGSWPVFRGFRSFSSPPGQGGRTAYRFRTRWDADPGRLLDWNGDGRVDWVVEDDERSGAKWLIHLQDEEGRFDRKNPIVPGFPENDEEENDEEREADAPVEPIKMRLPTMGVLDWDNLADVDGDGRLDLVRVTGYENWAMPKTRIAVYLQTARGTFPRKPDSLVRLRAVLPNADVPLSDVDADGDLDLLVLKLDLQVGSADSHMKAFFRKGLRTELGAHLWSERSGHSSRPAWEKRVIITHDMFEFTREPRPVMRFDRDLTGDGRPDLVLRTGRNKVGVFAMTDARTGFSKEPTGEFEAPFTVEGIQCDDYDGDGKIDIFVLGWDPDNKNRTPWGICFVNPAN